MKLKYALGTLGCAYFSFNTPTTTVQMSNLALIETKQITMYGKKRIFKMEAGTPAATVYMRDENEEKGVKMENLFQFCEKLLCILT